MKREELKEREVYVLTKDVENPKPDKRYGRTSYDNWPCHEKLHKGTRFFIDDFRRELLEKAQAELKDVMPWQYSVLRCFDARFKNNAGLTRPRDTKLDKDDVARREFYDAIVDALEPAPVTLDVFFHQHGYELNVYDATTLIESMLRHGEVTWGTLTEGFVALDRDRAEERATGTDLPSPTCTRPAG